MIRFRIGVDMGGTKIEGLVLDTDGNILIQHRIPTPRSYTETLDALAGLVKGLEDQLGENASVGVGTPGSLSPHTGLIQNANATWINGTPLARELSDRLGRTLRFENDANCFALSEAKGGAAAGARVVFGVILGTGTGGGIVVDGLIWRGINAVAGEWGHNPLPSPRKDEWPGPDCYCGRKGCIETFLSGAGLTRDYEAETGRRLEPPAVAKMATRGEPEAVESLRRYHGRLARSLASVINLLDPDVIVVGGGLSNLESLYTQVPSEWPKYVFADGVATRLVRAAHGDSSGARGAAMLWDV